ncbi:MAG: hypothetical protein QXR44_02275 [Thermoproteota archaeon]
MKEIEEQEEPRVEADEEYGDSSLTMMEANLSEDEKRENEERMEEENEAVTSDRLVLLQKPEKGEEGGNEALETEDHLRELIEGIEALAEGSLQREEKPENLEEKLSD